MKYLVSAFVGFLVACSGERVRYVDPQETVASVQSNGFLKTDTSQHIRSNLTFQEPTLGESILTYSYEEILHDQAGSNCIGGGGGTWFMFHNHGSTIRDLTIWGNGANGGFHAIEVTLFDETHTLLGDPLSAGNPLASFTFQPGERISGDLTLSGNGIGTRTGYLAFNTNQGRTFSAGNSGHDHYRYPADGRFLTGFFGRQGGDIDLLGVYFGKKLSRTELTNVAYPTLDTNSEICQPPTMLSKTHVTNPTPAGTWPASMAMSYAKMSGSNSCWTSATSLSFGQEFKVSGGVPFVAGGEATTKWGIEMKLSFSWCENTQTTVTETHTMYIAPQQDCVISATQCIGKLDRLPYTAYLTMYFASGGSYGMTVDGYYEGAQATVASVESDCKAL